MLADFRSVETLTFFVDDLNDARQFYNGLLDLPVVYEDEVSFVVKLENVLLNLLAASEAVDVIDPLTPGPQSAGPRFMITVTVADAVASHAELTGRGVTFLNGPIDRPWGRRTAAFADPAGIVWEIAQLLP